MGKVVVGLSGGVDSSVAAAALQTQETPHHSNSGETVIVTETGVEILTLSD